MTARKTVGIAEHISVALVTVGAHRLWISLWTPLGWPADNAAAAGGNGGMRRPGAGCVHSPSPARPRPHTGPVTRGTALGWDIARCPQDPPSLRRLRSSFYLQHNQVVGKPRPCRSAPM